MRCPMTRNIGKNYGRSDHAPDTMLAYVDSPWTSIEAPTCSRCKSVAAYGRFGIPPAEIMSIRMRSRFYFEFSRGSCPVVQCVVGLCQGCARAVPGLCIVGAWSVPTASSVPPVYPFLPSWDDHNVHTGISEERGLFSLT